MRIDATSVLMGYRLLAANAIPTVDVTDRVIELSSTDAANKACIMSAAQFLPPYEGKELHICLSVRSSTGRYDVPCTRGATAGNVALDAAGEGCILRLEAGVWRLLHLTGGATFS